MKQPLSVFLLKSPLEVRVSKNKTFVLNLNRYRNEHYHVLNKAKVVYKEVMSDQIVTLPFFDEVETIYTLYTGTRRLCDPRNVLTIVDKFFMDALVECGKLEDDNYIYDKGSTFRFGGVDKEDPRVIIELRYPHPDVGLDYFTGH